VLIRLFMTLVLFGAVGGGAVFALAQRQPSVAEGLKPVVVSAQSAKTFDDKVRTIQAAADEAKRTGRATPVEVTFTEQELTSKIAEATAGFVPSGVVATDTQIHLAGGNIVATSKVNVQGIDVSVGVVATPIVENGQTTIVVKEIQTGGLPLPDSLKREIQATVGQAIDPRSFGVPLDIATLRIVEGKLVITGTAKP
jgi:hypothetical protein